MSARQRPFVHACIATAVVLVVPQLGYGQCDPPGPNTKCWDNEQATGSWNTPENWDPDGVPLAQHDVFHEIAGTITYNVPVGNPNNQTIASFTAGGSATGLDILAGLTLTVAGKVEYEGTGEYELELQSRADMTVVGDVRFVNVTLKNGIENDDTTVDITGNVAKGDWEVPEDTRVTINGDVDATGYKWA